MGEIFREIVNKPHEAVGSARQKMQEMYPSNKGAAFAKWTGVGMAGLLQFLLWATKYLTLDNHVTRALENRYTNKGNKYPNLSAHLTYYAMMAAAILAAPEVYEAITADKEPQATEVEATTPMGQPGTYGAYLDRMRSITPLLIADLIAKEGVHVNANGMHTPYRDSKGIPTIGFGSTLLKDGSRVTMDTPPISTEEAYELSRWHLEQGETYFVLYCYDVAFGNVNISTTSQAFGMSSIVYNSYSKLIENPGDRNHRQRFAELRQIYNEYGLATPDSLVKEVFRKYPVRDARSFGEKWLGGAPMHETANKLGNFMRDGRGLIWRRWLEAGLLTGDITPEMMLDCPANGMYEFFCVMGQKKSAFFTGTGENKRVNRDTYAKFKEWLRNPVNARGQRLSEKQYPRVIALLPAQVRGMCEGGHCKLGDLDFIAQFAQSQAQQRAQKDAYVIGYLSQYNKAVAAYRAGDYEGALAMYRKMVEQYPNNALIHNDLAATYNQLGQYDNAIEHARIILNTIGDKSQYGAAQYNAGFAYEQKGNLQKALANYRLALANGNRRVQRDITRVTNMMQLNQNGRGKKSKREAFARGVQKLGNYAHSADFDVSMFLRGGKDI